MKTNPDGSISRYKARLVTQGFNQAKGLDYDEIFSPVVRHNTIRFILALAAMNSWELRQLDVKNALLTWGSEGGGLYGLTSRLC